MSHLLGSPVTRLSALALLAGMSAVAPASQEVYTFDCVPGDTLVVQNDYGKIRVRAWGNRSVEAKVRRSVAGIAPERQVQVVSRKADDKIFLYAFFAGSPGETVEMEIEAPDYVNVVAWGANPEIDLQGIRGYVRAQTFTGDIFAGDLTSSVSLISDRGSITYYSSTQPEGDLRLESSSGTIRLDLDRNLNFRAWMRAGSALSWEGEPTLHSTVIERQVGIGGPLLYARSMAGSVEVGFGGRRSAKGNDPGAPVQSTRQEPALPSVRDGEETRARDSGTPVLRDRDPEPGEQAPLPTDGSDAPTRDIPPPSVRSAPASGSGPPVDGGYTFKVNVRSVYLNVSVRDRHTNRSIPHLGRDDFLVYEDSVLQQVEQMVPMEAPFNLLLLLDVSGSTQSYIDLIREASIDFTREIKENDRIAVAVFNSRVRLIQEFTSDRRQAAHTISRIRSGGGTAFYDALETCIEDYLRDVDGRKAIVVFSDGVDNQLTGDYGNGSSTTFEELYRKIQEADTIIYTIFLETERHFPSSTRRRGGVDIGDILGDIIRGRLPSPQVPRQGQNVEEAREQMQLIADQTGGRMYSPRRIEDLARVYTEIADDLRIQYQLGYNSTNTAQDGTWRSIRVTIRDRPDAVARTRRGYYANK